MENVRHN